MDEAGDASEEDHTDGADAGGQAVTITTTLDGFLDISLLGIPLLDISDRTVPRYIRAQAVTVTIISER